MGYSQVSLRVTSPRPQRKTKVRGWEVPQSMWPRGKVLRAGGHCDVEPQPRGCRRGWGEGHLSRGKLWETSGCGDPKWGRISLRCGGGHFLSGFHMCSLRCVHSNMVS